MSYAMSNGKGTPAVNGNSHRHAEAPAGPSKSRPFSPSPSASPEDVSAYSQLAPSENGYHQSVSPSAHNEKIVNHLYHSGFQMGNYSDCLLHVQGRQYRLHAIILSRSPYLAHLMSTSPTNTIVVRLEEEPHITEEGFAIALGYLYSADSLKLIHTGNARQVLAAACLLGGMDDLCAHTFEVCRSSINVETIGDWLDFLETLPPSHSGTSTPESQPSVFGAYTKLLHDEVFGFLVETLPHELGSFPPEGVAKDSEARSALLRVYARLPFDIFRQAIQHPHFPCGTDQLRFQFANDAIALRKNGIAVGTEETVVLRFGGQDGQSPVHITRKVKNKKRPLWKVAK